MLRPAQCLANPSPALDCFLGGRRENGHARSTLVVELDRGGSMSSGSGPLVGHLSALRKGRGLLEPNLRRRLHDQVAVLCGIDDGDDLSTVRDKIVTILSDLLKHAPAEVSRAVMVSLAAEPTAQFPTLTARRDWL